MQYFDSVQKSRSRSEATPPDPCASIQALVSGCEAQHLMLIKNLMGAWHAACRWRHLKLAYNIQVS